MILFRGFSKLLGTYFGNSIKKNISIFQLFLGLLLDGVIALVPTIDTPCYQEQLFLENIVIFEIFFKNL